MRQFVGGLHFAHAPAGQDVPVHGIRDVGLVAERGGEGDGRVRLSAHERDGGNRPGVQFFAERAPQGVDGRNRQERHFGGGFHKLETVVCASFSNLAPKGLQRPRRVLGRFAEDGFRGRPPVLRDGVERKAEAVGMGMDPDKDFAHGHLRVQGTLEGRVEIAVEGHPFPQAFRVLAAKAHPFGDIRPEAADAAVRQDEGESVAVVEDRSGGGEGVEQEAVRQEAPDRADLLSQGRCGVRRGPGPFLPVEEEGGIAPVEGLAEVRGEAADDLAERGSPPVGMPPAEFVQGQAVGADDVPDVGQALEPAFDLEGLDTGLRQVFQALQEAVIFQRKQSFSPFQNPSGGIFQVIERAAGLDTFAPVRAPAGKVFREVALSAVTDAKGPMDEEFQFCTDGGTNFMHLLEGELAFQHQPAIAEAFGAAGVFDAADGALGGAVENRPFRGEPSHGGVLDDECVRPCVRELLQQAGGFLQFFLPYQGVESDVDTDTEAVGILTQRPDVLDAVPRAVPGSEGRAGDIHGIGTAVDGCDADGKIPCGSEQFERHYFFRTASC